MIILPNDWDILVSRTARHEGFREKWYDAEPNDGRDFLTIGHGFRHKYLKIPERISELLLDYYLQQIHHTMYRRYKWYRDIRIKQIQFVFTEMAYQIGIFGVGKFKKTIEFLKHEEWGKAATEMLDSQWARNFSPRAKKLAQIVANFENSS